MKSLLAKFLAAALTIAAFASAAPSASADVVYITDGSYCHSDHHVDYYRGERCYTSEVRCAPVERVYYHENCYSAPVYVCRPSCYSAQNFPAVGQSNHCR